MTTKRAREGTQKMPPPKAPKKAHTTAATTKTKLPDAAGVELGHWSDDDEDDEEEGEAKAQDLEGESEVKQVVRSFYKRVDALTSQALVSAELMATSAEMVQAKRKAVKVQLGTSKKALRGPMRDTLTEKAAMMAAAQAALEAAHVLAAESFSAEVAKVREEFAMWPEAAGIRAVCDLYADMQDREEARTAQTNRLGSRAAC